MKRLFFIVNIFALATLLYSDENSTLERDSFVLKLSITEENYWEWTVLQSPYIINENYIQLYPGENLFIEAEVLENKIMNFTVVKEIFDETKTIIVKFYQITKEENEKIHSFMMLEIKNPFSKSIEYKADIYLVEYNRWVDTSVIPVGAGLLSYESWPDIIGTIVLHDIMLK
jgi:hypothetical protein